MEGLKRRSWVLGLVLMGAGAWIQATPRFSPATVRDEAWMVQRAPRSAGEWREEGEYRMNEATYAELKPHGIVARKFGDGRHTFDVVVIASNRKESFHDPRVCFTSQGWNLLSQRQIEVDTPRGRLPMTLAEMSNDSHGKRLAAFLYRGPGGFYATPQSLSLQWLMRQMQGRSDNEAVFYRFIPDFDGATQADVEAFASAYLAAAQESSGGYF